MLQHGVACPLSSPRTTSALIPLPWSARSDLQRAATSAEQRRGGGGVCVLPQCADFQFFALEARD